jgi:hypothetical protein
VIESPILTPANPASLPGASAASPATPPHFLADLYTFDWSKFDLRLPLISASAVALCLFVGLAVGHPGGGLIAGGGAFTVGFGANQRISDSRIWPMIAAVFACASATLAGTVVGHRGYALVIAACGSAFIYGLLTTRNTGVAWVGQQASVALFVASAFPSAPRPALVRAALILAGGAVQILITSAGLRLLPDLQKHLTEIPGSLYSVIARRPRDLLNHLPEALPAVTHSDAFAYSIRLVITVGICSELYHRLGIQSGYWIPMTALLVQKPAFFETLTRASARILGTLAGAWLSTLLLSHVPLHPSTLAAITAVFALLAFSTNAVNYGLFTACLTSYIVFLLSLNQIPGTVIAHRRAWCTTLGAVIALVIHLDSLRRHRQGPTTS